MRVIDAHTEGEPTRVILDGGPELGGGSVAAMAERLERDHRDFCRGVLLEPRGHDAIVGALLVPSAVPDCVTGVIYFNPAGFYESSKKWIDGLSDQGCRLTGIIALVLGTVIISWIQ